MKKLSFYWNWLARVAKANNQQRQAVVKSATSRSLISGKTVIFAILATVAVLLVPQTTMQSAKSIVAPDLPDPPPHREVLLPPFPPRRLRQLRGSNGFENDNHQSGLRQSVKRTPKLP